MTRYRFSYRLPYIVTRLIRTPASTANGGGDGDGDGDELLMYYILLFNPTRAFSS